MQSLELQDELQPSAQAALEAPDMDVEGILKGRQARAGMQEICPIPARVRTTTLDRK